jgi:3-oxoacyl-(acyl-carrier-protein) synthase/surfactin synthase thioesterase subunit/acyl carrier protein
MDPQQRKLLEITCRSFGSNRALSSKSGVFIGIQHMEYKSIIAESVGPGNSYASTSSSFGIAAGRISFSFALTGPSLSIDTACSSALVALSLCHDHVRQTGDSSLASSVSIMLSRETFEAIQSAGMTSLDGRCKTLDQRADGYGRSEGVAVSLITADAKIGACAVLGAAVNQDGRSSSLTAPSGPSQQKLIECALQNSCISHQNVSSVILHGTGTALGDPVEINAAEKVFGSSSTTILAPKSILGHGEPVSGHFGSAMAIESIQCLINIPILHLQQLNPYLTKSIKGDGLWPCRQTCSNSLVSAEKKSISISAFAFQGTNANLIISQNSRITERAMVAHVPLRQSSMWVYPMSLSTLIRAHRYARGLALELKIDGSLRHTLCDHVANGRRIVPFTSILGIYTEASNLLQISNMACAHATAHSFAIMEDHHTTDISLLIQMDTTGDIGISSLSKVSGKYLAYSFILQQYLLQESKSSHTGVSHPLTSCMTYCQDRYISIAQIYQYSEKTCNLSRLLPEIDCTLQVSGAYSNPADPLRFPVSSSCSTVRNQAQSSIQWALSSMNIHTGDMEAIVCDYSGFGNCGVKSCNVENMQFRAQAQTRSEKLVDDNHMVFKFYHVFEEMNSNSSQDPIEISDRSRRVIFNFIASPTIPAKKYQIRDSDNILVPILQLFKEENISIPIFVQTSNEVNSQSNNIHSPVQTFTKSLCMELGHDALFHTSQSALSISENNNFKDHDLVHIGSGGVFTKQIQESAVEDLYPRTDMIGITRWNSDIEIHGGTGSIGWLINLWRCTQDCASQGKIQVFGRRGYLTRGQIIVHCQKDVTITMRDQGSSEDVLSDIWSTGESLTIFYAPGVTKDMHFSRLTPGTLNSVIAPKAHGFSSLIESSKEKAVHFVCAFSSIASTFLNFGQSNYSAANAMMNRISENERIAGRDIVCIEWGPWNMGMARDLQEKMMSHGLYALDATKGIHMLETILVYRNHLSASVIGALAESVYKEEQEMTEQHEPIAHIKVQGKERVHESIVDSIRKIVTDVLGRDIGDDHGFMEAGLDSMGSIEVRNKIVATMNIDLGPTAAFDHPSINKIATFISEDILLEKVRLTKVQESISQSENSLRVYVGSIASRIPICEQSYNVHGFDKCIISNIELITQVPASRWDLEQYYDPLGLQSASAYTRFGGFCSNVFHFDSEIFSFSQQESIWMDPQTRMLLQDHMSLVEQNHDSTGVFVGCMYHEFLTDLPKNDMAIPSHAIIGNGASYMAGRISYTFGWNGPSLCTDTACSSSLVAVHLACDSLKLNESMSNFTSGVNLMLSPSTINAICHLKALSEAGRCQTFSSDADGYGRSESCIVLSLHLNDFRMDAPRSFELKSSFINQDGRSSGLTAPNGPAQTSLLQAACRLGNVAPSDVQAISTHGTGTSLGDPIEVNAARRAYKSANKITLMASKSYVNHSEGAAGLMGLLFAAIPLISLRQTPTLHLRNLSKFVSQSLESLTSSMRFNRGFASSVQSDKLTGCSAFGMSGINAHALASGIEGAYGDGAPILRAWQSILRSYYCCYLPPRSTFTIAFVKDQLILETNPMQAKSLHKQVNLQDAGHLVLIQSSATILKSFYVDNISRVFIRDIIARAAIGIHSETSLICSLSPSQGILTVGTRQGSLWRSNLCRGSNLNSTVKITRTSNSNIFGSISQFSGRSLGQIINPGIHFADLQSFLGPRQILGPGFVSSIEFIQLSDVEEVTYWDIFCASDGNTSSIIGVEPLVQIAGIHWSPTVSPHLTDEIYNVVEEIHSIGTSTSYKDLLTLNVRLSNQNGEIQSHLSAIMDAAANGQRPIRINSKNVHTSLHISDKLYHRAMNGYISGFISNMPLEIRHTKVHDVESSLVVTPGASTSHEYGRVRDGLYKVKKVINQKYDMVSIGRIRKNGCLSMSGGTGALSLCVAKWWTSSSDNTVHLFSRTGSFTDRYNLLNHHIMLSVERLDPSSKSDALYYKETSRCLPINCMYIHASGSQLSSGIFNINPKASRFVSAPKSIALINSIIAERPISLTTLFSSLSSILGNRGNTTYSSANAAIDRLASSFSDQGMTFQSILWGAWASIGMAAEQWSASKEDSLRMGMLSVNAGLSALEKLFSSLQNTSEIVVAPQRYWENMSKVIPHVAGLIEDTIDLNAWPHDPLKIQSKTTRSNANRDKEDVMVLRRKLNEAMINIIGSSYIDVTVPLGQQGLESLSSLDLKAKIEEITGKSVLVEDLISKSPQDIIHDIFGARTQSEAAPGEINDLEQVSRPASRHVKPKMRLFCLPWAGGASENLFTHWSSILPACIEVFPVQIPGKGRRSEERPFEQVSELSDYLVETLPLEEMPYAIFGTCLGAIVGYDMIQKIERLGRRRPLLFMPAAVSPPHKYASVIMDIYNPRKSLLRWLQGSNNLKNDVLSRLKQWKTLPREEVLYAFEAGHFAGLEEMKQSEALFNRVAPMAVNDIIMAVQYQFSPLNRPISAPIVAFDGLKDNTIPKGYMKGWSKHTESTFKRVLVNSNHYFVASKYMEVANKCGEACLTQLEATDPLISSNHSWIGSETSQTQVTRNSDGISRKSRWPLYWLVLTSQLLSFLFLGIFWRLLIRLNL